MMPTMQAIALYEALSTTKAVLDGLLCQPRFGEENGVANAAGEVLSQLRDHIAEQAESAIAQAAQSQPRDKYAKIFWASAILRHAADSTEDADVMIAFAQTMSNLPIQGRIPA